MQIPWIHHTHIWTTYSQSKTRAGSVESHFIDMNGELTGKRYRTATRLWKAWVVRKTLAVGNREKAT
ncbi:hypothetical protein D623_10028111 [Myotis brandtii]|uniref:Uncharacterized protein n=1 Tax=Myotis brandtii TaxID=109478 RepID=S7MPF9_MYOBR|nr:hypothetical protein D623_10028111 [Myotis brandtii]